MFDLVIDNTRLCDGSGGPGLMGSPAVTDGRIAAPGALRGAAARQPIDAGGQVLAPGFIDPHTHYDALRVQCSILCGT